MSDSIQGLLKAFSKQPGCEAYKGDAKQISLVCLYLFIRQLTPSLPFEEFLKLYAPFADADEQNLKLPETAVDVTLPRAAAKAQKQNTRQWSAKEVIGFLALYVDMIRTAEMSSTPVPMTLQQWICNPQMQQMYINGGFDVAEEPADEAPVTNTEQAQEPTAAAAPAATATKTRKARTPKAKTQGGAMSQEARPTRAGQRVLYKHPSGQYLRGVTDKVETLPATDGDRVYVTFTDDSGQLHEGASALLFKLIDDPPPQPPQNVSQESAVIVETIEIDITDNEATTYTQWLQCNAAVNVAEPGATLWEWDDIHTQNGVEYKLVIKLVNGDAASGPHVDAYAVHSETPDDADKTVVFEMVPRNFAILGAYMFVLPHGTARVVIQRETPETAVV